MRALLVGLIICFFSPSASAFEIWAGTSVAVDGLADDDIQSVSLHGRVALIPIGPIQFSPMIRYTYARAGDAFKLKDGVYYTLGGLESHAINAGFALDWTLLGMLEIGMNLDIVGVGFGPSENLFVTGQDVVYSVSPSGVNLFLFGKADLGMLNSQFYVALTPMPGLRVLAGLSHQVVHYTSVSDLGEAKLQKFYNLFALGLELSI